MRSARSTVATAAGGSVLAALLLVPATVTTTSRVEAAPVSDERIAFTADRDDVGQVEVVRTDPPTDPPTEPQTGPQTGPPGNIPMEPPSPNLAAAHPLTPVGPVFTPGTPTAGPLSGRPTHQGELSGTRAGAAYVSTSDTDSGEVYALNGDKSARRVTCNAAHESHPVVARGDGEVAWSTDLDGNWDVYMAEPDPGNNDNVGGTCDGWRAERITDDVADDLWPAFVPDQQHLVFSSTRDRLHLGDLYEVNLDDIDVTGPEQDLRRLTDGAEAETQPTVVDFRRTAWVLFTSTRERPDGSLMMMPLSRPEETELEQPFSPWPAAPPQASEASASTESEPHVAFTSTGQDPYGDIQMGRLTFDDCDHPQIVDVQPLSERPGVSESHPNWFEEFQDQVVVPLARATVDPGPRAVVTFTQHSIMADVDEVRAEDGSDRRTIAPGTRAQGEDSDVLDAAGPSYSPDGHRIAYSASRADDGGGRAIVTARSDGSGAAVLSTGEEGSAQDIDVDPVWSPDGSRIAFTRYEADGEDGHRDPQVYVVSSGGGDARALSLSNDDGTYVDSGPAWSPDGRWIVLDRVNSTLSAEGDPQGPDLIAARAGDGGPFQRRSALWVVDPDNASNTFPLLQGVACSRVQFCHPQPVAGRSASWSPDGSRLVYVSMGQLMSIAMPASTASGPWITGPPVAVTGFTSSGEPTPIRRVLSAAADPVWSPDGSEIAFAGQPAGQPDQSGIYAIRPDGTKWRRVTDDRGPETEPAWSPEIELPRSADVSVDVSVTPSSASVGEPLTVTFTVRNEDTRVTARDVDLATRYATDADTVASAAPPGCRTDGTGCRFPTLAPGESREYVVTVTHRTPVEGFARAEVTASTVDPDLRNNERRVPYQVDPVLNLTADVSVNVALDHPVGWVGGRRTATVRVRNAGPDDATAVELSLAYPPAATPSRPFSPRSALDCRNGLVACSLGTIAAGDGTTFEVPLLLEHGGNGAVSATVTATSGDPAPDNNTDLVDLPVLQPTVRLLPPVARPGAVTMAYGENMPPRSRVKVTWMQGVTVHGQTTFRVRKDGTMRAPLLVVRHDLVGQREVEAQSVPGQFSPVRGPMLVTERLATAPDFLTRG